MRRTLPSDGFGLLSEDSVSIVPVSPVSLPRGTLRRQVTAVRGVEGAEGPAGRTRFPPSLETVREPVGSGSGLTAVFGLMWTGGGHSRKRGEMGECSFLAPSMAISHPRGSCLEELEYIRPPSTLAPLSVTGPNSFYPLCHKQSPGWTSRKFLSVASPCDLIGFRGPGPRHRTACCCLLAGAGLRGREGSSCDLLLCHP